MKYFTPFYFLAGPAVITVPPQNTSKLEGGKVEFICEAKALPANITHKWYHNGVDISQLTWLESRSLIRKDGLLFISPLTAEDSGVFTCEVSNGIGSPDSASAYLSVECKSQVHSQIMINFVFKKKFCICFFLFFIFRSNYSI